MRKSQSGWGIGDEDDDEDEEDGEQYYYNENVDEDEFGLPSISSIRRDIKNRAPLNKVNDPGGGRMPSENSVPPVVSPEQISGRGIAQSSDIAEEREPLNYPSAKKSEGKILRPQYKDILRGLCYRNYCRFSTNVFSSRPCKFLTPYKPSSNGSKCNFERKRSSFRPHITYQQVQAHSASKLNTTYRAPRLIMVRDTRRGASNVVAAAPRLSPN